VVDACDMRYANGFLFLVFHLLLLDVCFLVDLFLASYDTFCLVVEKYMLSGGVVFIDFFVDGFCGFV